MYVVGTAGHVDHGKSTLVKALTGMDPDRLQEEKDRGMTIDLGFAWLRLPGGNEVSIVDVPGHERFIKNMLAGVGGIDLALLVVAADEGVMPQTSEHLAIIDLLQVQRGIVALTKRDLVDDDWLELVTEDVRARLQGTVLATAPIVPVSSVTGQGLTELKASLVTVLAETSPKRDIGRPRLPVDRIFTIGGFGTVVTGTLVDGRLQVGQEVEILPRGLRSRIRGLQTHKRKAESAVPGSRVAVNLVGLAVSDLARGDVLTLPGWLTSTTMVDARLRLVADLAQPLRHNARVSLHTGAAEVAARVRLLTGSEARAGETVWVQLELEAPAAVVKGDYLVIRSPNATLGGGQIVDAHARRRRRNCPEVVASLETLAKGSPDEVLLQTLADKPPVELGNLVAASGLTEAEVRSAVERLAATGQVVVLSGESHAARGLPVAGRLRAASLVVSTLGWNALRQRATAILTEYHGRNPLRQGMPKEELKSRLALPPRAFNESLARWLAEPAPPGLAASTGWPTPGEGSLTDEGAAVRLPSHSVRFTPQQEQLAARALAAMQRDPFAPPPRADLERDLGMDLLQALLDQGRLLKLSEDVILTPDAYRQMVDAVLEDIRARGATSVAAIRDRFSTSRRYAIALLEHLDETRVTRRQGDDRVLY